MRTYRSRRTGLVCALAALWLSPAPVVWAQPVPGGSLDPTTIPKYVTPLVIPPEMPASTTQPQPGVAADYNIAVRQFTQQILPAGYLGTPVWSYGLAEDAVPVKAPDPNSSFNYPAFTIEVDSGDMTTVRWINGLESGGVPLPHLLKDPTGVYTVVDQTLHWANPGSTPCTDLSRTIDCRTDDPSPYMGAVPIVTHVHGAHVNSESDGYPEAWWLPASANPADYTLYGTLYDQYDPANTVPGSAFFAYENDQPATTLWYHDHTLGMTRLNVYAGPAGFWIVRGGDHGDDYVDDAKTPAPADGVLPGPAPFGAVDPNFTPAHRATIREIPLAIQDRSFNADGTLWYPSSRADFDGYVGPYIPNDSDISPIWNPEAFFNTMVVNGNTWPYLEVAPALYRFRLLNGCNSRFLNLSLQIVSKPGPGRKGGCQPITQGPCRGAECDMMAAYACGCSSKTKANPNDTELPFYQIGAEQGFLPQVVRVETGFATPLTTPGKNPKLVAADSPQQALLMGPAERADVLVDFGCLPDGTVVRLINTGPDAPFGGFPDTPADPGTSGQVMEFVVSHGLMQPHDALVTSPLNLVLPAESSLDSYDNLRQVGLFEEESAQVCVQPDADDIPVAVQTYPTPQEDIGELCEELEAEPMAPRAALLGTLTDGPLLWANGITENPEVGDVEDWEIYNFTEDAHPIHLHLVRFQVISRDYLNGLGGNAAPPQPWETGFKDTVIAYPGQVTRIRAHFDLAGLYVWHCHIVEHEDNEMMRPYCVGEPGVDCPATLFDPN